MFMTVVAGERGQANETYKAVRNQSCILFQNDIDLES